MQVDTLKVTSGTSGVVEKVDNISPETIFKSTPLVEIKRAHRVNFDVFQFSDHGAQVALKVERSSPDLRHGESDYVVGHVFECGRKCRVRANRLIAQIPAPALPERGTLRGRDDALLGAVGACIGESGFALSHDQFLVRGHLVIAGSSERACVWDRWPGTAEVLRFPVRADGEG